MLIGCCARAVPTWPRCVKGVDTALTRPPATATALPTTQRMTACSAAVDALYDKFFFHWLTLLSRSLTLPLGPCTPRCQTLAADLGSQNHEAASPAERKATHK